MDFKTSKLTDRAHQAFQETIGLLETKILRIDLPKAFDSDKLVVSEALEYIYIPE